MVRQRSGCLRVALPGSAGVDWLVQASRAWEAWRGRLGLVLGGGSRPGGARTVLARLVRHGSGEASPFRQGMDWFGWSRQGALGRVGPA